MREPEPIIRLADPKSETDLGDAAKIISSAFLKQAVAKTDKPTITIDELKVCLSSKQNELFLLGHPPIGTALLTVQGDHVYIWCVSILPTFQGQNLGLKLMDYMERRASEVHRKKIAIVTVVYHPHHKQESLMKWYEKQGYEYSLDKLAPDMDQFWKPEYHKELHLKEFRKILR